MGFYKEDKQSMRNLVIVGGGLAGVLTAKSVLSQMEEWKVTLIEDPQYRGKGGIKGESLTPSFVSFVQEQIGHEKTEEWLAYSKAAAKVGTKFEGWGRESLYLSQDMNRREAMPFETWLKHSKTSKDPRKDLLSINKLCFPAVAMMEDNTCPSVDVSSPRTREEQDWSVNLDASQLAEYLLQDLHDCYHTPRFKYVASPILEVVVSPTGVQSIEVQGGSVKGEVYVDASGTGRVLVGAIGALVEDQSHRFINDRAIYGTVPCPHKINHVRSLTATSGWIWEIPLQHETSVGYVYSSKFISEEDAVIELEKEYPDIVGAKLIPFSPDQVPMPWTKNVVALGVAQGFVDPLAANVLLQTKTHIQALIRELHSPALGYVSAAKFNKACNDHREAITSFVELHYRGCVRRDTEYWRFVTAIPHISKGMENFLSHYTDNINGRQFDWVRWVVLAAGLRVLDLDDLKG
jgi:tryptophan 7-halogenase